MITLNRPEARNAVNRELAVELEAAVDRLEDDPDTWAGVLCADTAEQAMRLGLADVLLDGADFLAESLRWAARVVSGAQTVRRPEVDHPDHDTGEDDDDT